MQSAAKAMRMINVGFEKGQQTVYNAKAFAELKQFTNGLIPCSFGIF